MGTYPIIQSIGSLQLVAFNHFCRNIHSEKDMTWWCKDGDLVGLLKFPKYMWKQVKAVIALPICRNRNTFKSQVGYGSGEFTMVDSAGISSYILKAQWNSFCFLLTQYLYQNAFPVYPCNLDTTSTQSILTFGSTRQKLDAWSQNPISKYEEQLQWASGHWDWSR